MRAAWRAADVRAAEKTLMATLPPGTLMARAAALSAITSAWAVGSTAVIGWL